MKDLKAFQMELFSNAKIVQQELDKMIMKSEVELKDLNLNSIQRNIIEDDKNRILWIKKAVRELEIFNYNWTGIFKEE